MFFLSVTSTEAAEDVRENQENCPSDSQEIYQFVNKLAFLCMEVGTRVMMLVRNSIE